MPCFPQQQLKMVCYISSGEVYSSNGMGHGETFENGNSMSDTIARIEDDTGCAARRVERENGLNRGEECWDVECFEKDLGGYISVLSRVERCLSK